MAIINLFAHNGHDHIKEALQYTENNKMSMLAISVIAATVIAIGISTFIYLKRKKKVGN